ncbi:histone H1.10-like [Dendropsophus ebraccatus]|uniref:histone H1.10-like n=1 Tax=Dendropsophus ebraccatus TaxID=150705 RepID=UPI003831598F
MAQQEVAPATPSKRARAAAGGSAKKSGNKKKKNQPGRYSQLVVDTIRKLAERNGSSMAKIYSEAKKVSWFDQQNGRTYLKYSVRALVQNDTLLQVKGIGANGSFRLNKKKLEGLAVPKRAAPKPAAKKPAAAPKKSPKKAKPAAKKSAKSPAKSPKKATPSRASKKVKKAAKPKALRAKKA